MAEYQARQPQERSWNFKMLKLRVEIDEQSDDSEIAREGQK